MDVDLKDVDIENVADTWPELAPIKFEPEPTVDPHQDVNFSDEEDAFSRARVASVCLASTSSSAQSLDIALPLTPKRQQEQAPGPHCGPQRNAGPRVSPKVGRSPR